MEIAKNKSAPSEIRWVAIQTLVTTPVILSPEDYFSFEFLRLSLAKEQGSEIEDQTRKTIKVKLLSRLARDPKADDFILKSLFKAFRFEKDRPTSDLIRLLSLLADPQTTQAALKAVEKGYGSEERYKNGRPFVALSLELTSPETKVDDAWIALVTTTFNNLEKSTSTEEHPHWQTILCDLLLAKKVEPARIIPYREIIVKRLLLGKKEDKTRFEVLRATTFLAEACAATGNPAPLKELLPQILPFLQSGKIAPTRNGLVDLTLRTAQAFAACGQKEFATSIAQLAEPELKRHPERRPSFAEFLPNPAPTPTP